jgi:colanic acid/amylovoran biosynthesis protein
MMHPMNIVITGVTLTGNMGGSAMLHAALQQLRKRFSGAQFHLISIYPKMDDLVNHETDLKICSASPLALLLLYMPLTFLGALGAGFRKILARRIGFFRTVSNADFIIDLSGIAFVDGRGLPLLWYNLSCALPGIVWHKPVFKLSQALGPFNETVNRIVARMLLGKCAAVVARGEQSLHYLKGLGLTNIYSSPDVSFALEVPDNVRLRAKGIFNNFNAKRTNWVVVSPSRVVENLCIKKGIDFLGQMQEFVNNIIGEERFNVLILPHSLGRGGSKNNDIELCRNLYERINNKNQVFFYVPDEDPILLRALIGHADFFVGCRFHAVVAALIMSVPTLVIGWSHKYREMAASFEADVQCLDFSVLNAAALTRHFHKAWNTHEETHSLLSVNGRRVSAQAIGNFDLVENYIRKLHACG